jgi:hypothetical protein
VLIALIIIALTVEAVVTSEILVIFRQTAWFNIPEDRHLHTYFLENLKSHSLNSVDVIYYYDVGENHC